MLFAPLRHSTIQSLHLFLFPLDIFAFSATLIRISSDCHALLTRYFCSSQTLHVLLLATFPLSNKHHSRIISQPPPLPFIIPSVFNALNTSLCLSDTPRPTQHHSHSLSHVIPFKSIVRFPDSLQHHSSPFTTNLLPLRTSILASSCFFPLVPSSLLTSPYSLLTSAFFSSVSHFLPCFPLSMKPVSHILNLSNS